MRLLHIDIETVPSLAYIWKLGQQYVGRHQVKDEGRVVCFAWKWDRKGRSQVEEDFEGGDPRTLAIRARDLLDAADAVVHYNGTSFDMPRLRSLILEAGLHPPSPVHEIDLYRTVKRRLHFVSNSLDHVAHRLGLGRKMATGGLDLWKDVLSTDVAVRAPACRKMLRYNRRDVLLQEKVYHALLPWIPRHPNVALFRDIPESDEPLVAPTCPACGSVHMQSRGWSRTASFSYRRYQCQDCGRWSRAPRSEPSLRADALPAD